MKLTKVQLVRRLIELSKNKDYVYHSERVDHHHFEWNSTTINYEILEFGIYIDTKGAWVKYHTKDVAKYYEFNPVEAVFLKNLFNIKWGVIC